MNEYTLKQDITSYKYPSHMIRPDGFFGSNFFEKWIPNWIDKLSHISGNPNITGIEIGCFNGDCSVFCAEKIANGKNSIHYIIDVNETPHLKNNISPYSNIKFIQGYSYEVLRKNFTVPKIADYIYIDGSHMSIDVIQDSVLSWYLLKDNGIMIWDDYGWGIHTNDEKQKPKIAIDAFLSAYRDHYQILSNGWQIFIKKLPYTYSNEELNANYQ